MHFHPSCAGGAVAGENWTAGAVVTGGAGAGASGVVVAFPLVTLLFTSASLFYVT